MSNDNEGVGKTEVRVGAKIPLGLHIVAKHIYSMQGTSIAERFEKLLRADLRKAMGRKWFKTLPDEEVHLTKWLMEVNAKNKTGSEA